MNLLRPLPLILLMSAIGRAALPASAPAAPPSPAAVVIEITRIVEDGKPMLNARVTVDGKPASGVTVEFSAPRTFGAVALGKDNTLDDGTAAVVFPTLPGAADGTLRIEAVLTAPDAFAGQHAAASLPAFAPRPAAADRGFARTLWSPHAPVPLLATLLVLLGGVWLTYGVVIYQIFKIKQEASS